jgi:hypothetical protein
MNQDNKDLKDMTCSEFQAEMPELIGAGENLATHPHLQGCERCTELLADLESIAEAARQLFPVADPPDTLWAHIESAIKAGPEANEPAVAPLDEGKEPDPGLPPSRRKGCSLSEADGLEADGFKAAN